MRITQKDIARELGISLITVNRALNNSGYVSEELKKRIMAVVKEKSYVPHKASQALVRNRTRNIAVFSSSLPEYFWGDIRNGVELAAGQIMPFNYSVRYRAIPESDTERYVRTLESELENGLDAAAFVNQRQYDMSRIIARLDRAGIPYVTFNIDAPESGRLCYIGSDYLAGGRLAADFIGTSLQAKRGGRVLVIGSAEERFSRHPDINRERLEGCLSVLRDRYPDTIAETAFITSVPDPGHSDSQIERILRERKGTCDAVYLIPAFNSTFLDALERLEYGRIITVLHDIDGSALHHLETHRLSGVIYQNPILQGYYTVKTLEHILDSGGTARIKDIEVVHNLVLAENRSLYRNHLSLAELGEPVL